MTTVVTITCHDLRHVDPIRPFTSPSGDRVISIAAKRATMSSTRVGASMAVVSMLCVQVGLAVAVSLIDDLGPAGTTWLRLAWAAPILIVVVRPRPSDFSASAFRATVLL